MDYFDLDSVLAGEETAKVKFRTSAFGLRYLDCSMENRQQDIEEGDKIELPFWLAEVLAKPSFVSMELQLAFKEKFRRKMAAGSERLNLFSKCPNFYSIGIKLSRLYNPEIASTLVDVYTERFRSIIDKSQNCQNRDPSKYTRILSIEERKLFNEVRKASDDYRSWKKRKRDNITESEIIRKTKRFRVA